MDIFTTLPNPGTVQNMIAGDQPVKQLPERRYFVSPHEGCSSTKESQCPDTLISLLERLERLRPCPFLLGRGQNPTKRQPLFEPPYGLPALVHRIGMQPEMEQTKRILQVRPELCSGAKEPHVGLGRQ